MHYDTCGHINYFFSHILNDSVGTLDLGRSFRLNYVVFILPWTWTSVALSENVLGFRICHISFQKKFGFCL